MAASATTAITDEVVAALGPDLSAFSCGLLHLLSPHKTTSLAIKAQLDECVDGEWLEYLHVGLAYVLRGLP